MVMSTGQQSLIEDHGKYKSVCGYCRSGASKTSIAHGMWAYSMTVDDYQELLDRGWRRSGCFMYKPDMRKTCCPPYTIRLKVDDFRPTKEHLRVLRRMDRYLAGDLVRLLEAPAKHEQEREAKCTVAENNWDAASLREGGGAELVPDRGSQGDQEQALGGRSSTDPFAALGSQIAEVVQILQTSGEFSQGATAVEVQLKAVPAKLKKQLGLKRSGQEFAGRELCYTCNAAFLIAASKRRQHLRPAKVPGGCQQGAGNCSGTQASNKPSPKQEAAPSSTERQASCKAETVAVQLAAKWQELFATATDPEGWFIEASNGHLNVWGPPGHTIEASSASQASGHTKPIHRKAGPRRERQGDVEMVPRGVESSEQLPEVRTSGRVERPQRRLEISTAQSSFDAEEFALYHKYQTRVHNDAPSDVTPASYKNFLVDTPLIHQPPSTSGRPTPSCGFGSFHQQYRIDGKLVAVGVVDILPHCLSSKYLFWDPELAHLSLGKFSALKEIEWVENASHDCPSLQFYYLGFYIHSCPKMRYKAAYAPSELLCTEHQCWLPHSAVTASLSSSYVELCQAAQNRESLVDPRGQGDVSQTQMLATQGSDVLHNSSGPARDDGGSRQEGSGGGVGDIALVINGAVLLYKQLLALDALTREGARGLTRCLQTWRSAVGPTLACRLKYVLDG